MVICLGVEELLSFDLLFGCFCCFEPVWEKYAKQRTTHCISLLKCYELLTVRCILLSAICFCFCLSLLFLASGQYPAFCFLSHHADSILPLRLLAVFWEYSSILELQVTASISNPSLLLTEFWISSVSTLVFRFLGSKLLDSGYWRHSTPVF